MDTLRSSLRARMTLGFTAFFAVLALLAWTGFMLWSRHAAHQDARERTYAAVRLVAQEWDGNAVERSVVKAFVEAHEDMRLDNIAMMIVDDTGRVLGRNRRPAWPFAEPRTLSWPNPHHDGWLTRKTRSRNAIIVAGMDWHPIETALRRQMLVLFLFALLMIGIAAAAAWTLVGRTLQPIGALSEQAKAASGDTLHACLVAPSDDAEVRRLVETLNGFLQRLRENTLAREQFYAAAAHELRTPLSVLSASVEVALSRPRDNAEYQETLSDLQSQTCRLTTLVQDLLTLNRLDRDTGADETKEAVDLADLCERTLSTFAPIITERRLRVRTDLESSRDVSAPLTHAAMLVRNLIENAVKYATFGGTVTISLRSVPEGTRLQISNDYAKSEASGFDKWFEPFYRADASRSAATGGNGLGLAICRRLADINDWSLLLAIKNDGVNVSVTFPSSRHFDV